MTCASIGIIGQDQELESKEHYKFFGTYIKYSTLFIDSFIPDIYGKYTLSTVDYIVNDDKVLDESFSGTTLGIFVKFHQDTTSNGSKLLVGFEYEKSDLNNEEVSIDIEKVGLAVKFYK